MSTGSIETKEFLRGLVAQINVAPEREGVRSPFTVSLLHLCQATDCEYCLSGIVRGAHDGASSIARLIVTSGKYLRGDAGRLAVKPYRATVTKRMV